MNTASNRSTLVASLLNARTLALALSFPLAALAQAQTGASGAATPSNDPPAVTIADAQRGSMVTLQGRVERILDEDAFRLCDASDCIKIDTGRTMVPVNQGEEVTVIGFIDRDLLREVYAREIRRASGEAVRTERW